MSDYKDRDLIITYECDSAHFFHYSCGTEWLKNKASCPLCRASFTQNINQWLSAIDDPSTTQLYN
jgi:hypothetical protein